MCFNLLILDIEILQAERHNSGSKATEPLPGLLSVVFNCLLASEFVYNLYLILIDYYSWTGTPLDSGPGAPLPDKKLLVFILDRLQKCDSFFVVQFISFNFCFPPIGFHKILLFIAGKTLMASSRNPSILTRCVSEAVHLFFMQEFMV